jgi:poly(3-hydroxybutyrate) depolymerase
MENKDWHVTEKEVEGGIAIAAGLTTLVLFRGKVNFGKLDHIIPAAENFWHDAEFFAARVEKAVVQAPRAVTGAPLPSLKGVPLHANMLQPIVPSGEFGRFVGEQAQTVSTELSQSRFPFTLRGTELKYPVNVDGDGRAVTVHLPPRFNPEKPTPIYYLADGAQYKDPTGEMLDGYHWATTADDNHFVAAALVQGSKSGLEVLDERLLRLAPKNTTWRTAHGFLNPTDKVNDITYFDRVHDGLTRAMKIDQVNFIGFCDGGNLGHALAAKTPFNGVATVGGTRMRDITPTPLPGIRGFFTTMEDDQVIPPGGGSGKAFGKFLIKLGQNNIVRSQPLEQAPMYAEVNGLRPGQYTATATATERPWLTVEGNVGALELSLKTGGHNWPGTVFDKATLTVARQVSPETAISFNQRIVDYLSEGYRGFEKRRE